jgi:hypothetical protein
MPNTRCFHNDMNLYILWASNGTKLATYASNCDRALEKAARAGFAMCSWYVGQMIDTKYARWI